MTFIVQRRRFCFRCASSSSSSCSSSWVVSSILKVVLILLLLLCVLPIQTNGFGGEKVAYTTTPLDVNVTHRQNVCDRYELFRAGQIELRFALEGLAIKPLMRTGDYFHYDEENGIDRADPGLMADLLDEVARRAGFTWRESFGVQIHPSEVNMTFTEMLLWTIETFDIAINWWDQSVERMERGVAYIEPWFDGSVILIDRQEPTEDSNTINLLNWLRPFETQVWVLTVATIIVSGLVYQFIEYLHDEREARPWYQWLSDNLYLSALNFTQNYEYAPNSFAGRIFGVSMGIWALVMTATYTANLASLFVEEGKPPFVVESIDQAIANDYPICTYRNTNADFIIRQKYENAIRVPKLSELEAYQALQRGECELVAGYKDNWLGYRGDSQYNPDCDLEWVGRTVEVIKSGFAVKADAGHLCTSLIRDVVNLHLTEVISDGVLADAWEKHRSKRMDINCDAPQEGSDTERRLRRRTQEDTSPPFTTLARHTGNSSTKVSADTDTNNLSHAQNLPYRQSRRRSRRQLKGSSNSAAASSTAESDPSSSSLNMSQMLGCFVLHWAMMFAAVIAAAISSYMTKRAMLKSKDKAGGVGGGVAGHHKTMEHIGANRQALTRGSITYRTHGPIIGKPPPVNTSFVIRGGVGPLVDTVREEDDITSDDTDFEYIQNQFGKDHYSRDGATTGGSGEQRDILKKNYNRDIQLQKLHTEFKSSQRLFASTQRDWRASHSELQNQMNTVVTMLQEMRQEQQQQQQRYLHRNVPNYDNVDPNGSEG